VLARAARPEGPERLPSLRPPPAGRRALNLRALLLLLAALLACAALTGCGGNDEPATDTTPTVPDLTLPQTDETQPAPRTETQTETAPPEPTETVPPPETNGGTTAPKPAPPTDSPQNDAPPPQDTPAERFEEFCNENPGACG
jgi:hypothetical protein